MMNLSYTIRAESQERCNEIAAKIDKVAGRLGVPSGHTDMSEPQSRDHP